jgi:predicted N-acetyltransferase YhbS
LGLSAKRQISQESTLNRHINKQLKIKSMNKKFEYYIRYGFDEMDFDKVQNMLKDVFWSIGIQKSEIIQGAKNSALLVGTFTKDKIQIGYSRVISDKTRFAYILDVIVDEKFRKQGIGQAMIRHILNHPELKDVYQWVLITKDAHGVYKNVGFNSLSRPNDWMEIRNDRPKR